MSTAQSITRVTARIPVGVGTLATVVGVLVATAVTTIVLALAPTSAAAAAKLRGCGYQAYTYVSATPNVGCRTAERVIGAEPCGFGTACQTDGFTCRMSSISLYAYEVACIGGRREIVGLGDLPKP
jgi:hypothetical protein